MVRPFKVRLNLRKKYFHQNTELAVVRGGNKQMIRSCIARSKSNVKCDFGPFSFRLYSFVHFVYL